MKHLLRLIIISFLVQPVNAQEQSAAMAFIDKRCKHSFITLSPKKSNSKLKNRFPFREIKVVDYRPDSVRIGLFAKQRQLTDLRFNGSPGNNIELFLNKTYSNPLATQTLLVVIKDLWFSDIVHIPDAVPTRLRTRIKFRVETYLKDENGYVPMAYFDTLIVTNMKLAQIAPFAMPELISACINKIMLLDIDHVNLNAKRHLSFAAVDSFSKGSFTYPVTTATSLQKGVYASFEEFRNNNPSVLNYTIEKENNAFLSLRLIDEQGKSYYSRRMWGYCDGEETFVMMDGNLFPVIKYDGAYYVYGSKNYKVKTNIVPVFMLFPGTLLLATMPVSETVTRNLRLFRLDIQTGEIE